MLDILTECSALEFFVTDKSLPFDYPDLSYCCGNFMLIEGGWEKLNEYYLSSDQTRVNVTFPQQLARATPKRKAEFMAGRICAMNAINELTGSVANVPINSDRSPAWPVGLVGSISHNSTQAAAVVGYANRYLGLGLDLEGMIKDEDVASIAPMILSADECKLRPTRWNMNKFLTMAFSVKEALYKAIYPSTRQMIDFLDVRIDRLESEVVVLKMGNHVYKPNLGKNEFHVHYMIRDEVCLSLLALDACR